MRYGEPVPMSVRSRYLPLPCSLSKSLAREVYRGLAATSSRSATITAALKLISNPAYEGSNHPF